MDDWVASAAVNPTQHSTEMRARILRALQSRRGRYPIDRASQLSGIPRSTIYEWRSSGNLLPDFKQSSPIAWSYRDLVYLRLLAWLRQRGMPRPQASELVRTIRQSIADGHTIERLRSDGRIILTDDAVVNAFGGENVFPMREIVGLMGQFDLLQPIAELGTNKLWGPDLVTPSELTYISPWVMAGEPCVKDTRIPTSSLYALTTDRGLSPNRIVELYNGLSRSAVEDALELEVRLRRVA